jgi:ribosome recycling factor
VTARLQQVYCANILVEAENNNNKLPTTCRRTEARRLGAVKVSNNAEHARLVCVKARRDEMDVVEEIMDDVEEASDEEDVMEEDENENSDEDDN